MSQRKLPFGYSLSDLARSSALTNRVRKAELRVGDTVFVRTSNSLYTIRLGNDGKFLVSGGWFSRYSATPVAMTITGCTWGGSAILVDAVAAIGQRIEFANRVVTSPVSSFFVIPREILN